MKALFITICVIFLSSCAPIEPLSVSGRNISYEHGIGASATKRAYEDANARCKMQGLTARPVGSSCPFRCVTNFVCE